MINLAISKISDFLLLKKTLFIFEVLCFPKMIGKFSKMLHRPGAGAMQTSCFISRMTLWLSLDESFILPISLSLDLLNRNKFCYMLWPKKEQHIWEYTRTLTKSYHI